jgi:hypothetical protein
MPSDTARRIDWALVRAVRDADPTTKIDTFEAHLQPGRKLGD